MFVERFADDEHHVGLAFLTTRLFPILLLYVGTSFKFLFKFPIFQMRLPEVPKGVTFDGRVQLCRQIVIAVGICAENRALTPTIATAPANATFFQRLFGKSGSCATRRCSHPSTKKNTAVPSSNASVCQSNRKADRKLCASSLLVSCRNCSVKASQWRWNFMTRKWWRRRRGQWQDDWRRE